MSLLKAYAAAASRPPHLIVTYFGLTLDGWHSFDVKGRDDRLLGVVKRRARKPDGYLAWRNGIKARAGSLQSVVDWLSIEAHKTGDLPWSE